VDQMAVDVEQTRSVRLTIDHVIVEDLVVQRLWSVIGHGARHTFQKEWRRLVGCWRLDSAVAVGSQIGGPTRSDKSRLPGRAFADNPKKKPGTRPGFK
jgi:hypothetical protein